MFKNLQKRRLKTLVGSLALSIGLSSFAPASFATWDGDVTVTYASVPFTLDNTNTTIAGRVGQQVSVAITGTFGAKTAATSTALISGLAATMTSQPSGSNKYPTLTAPAAAFGATGDIVLYASTDEVLYDTQLVTSAPSEEGTASDVANINYATDTNAAVTAA